MTLRQYYAAKAMQFIISNPKFSFWELLGESGFTDDMQKRIGEASFMIADAMLAHEALEKKDTGEGTE